MSTDFDLDRYLLHLDARERYDDEELRQIDESHRIDALFAEADFKPIEIKDFDPDKVIAMDDETGKRRRPFDYVQSCRNHEVVRQKREAKRKEEERLAEEQRRKEQEEQERIERQKFIDEHFWVYQNDLFKFTRDDIFGVQLVDYEHELYLCVPRVTNDMYCICILFDDMAYVTSDMLVPPADKYTQKGWFEHLFVYDALEKHLERYIEHDRLIEIGEWLRKTKRDIMNEFGFKSRDSNTYWDCVKDDKTVYCNRRSAMPCTMLSCPYCRHCGLCDNPIAHEARIHEFKIPD